MTLTLRVGRLDWRDVLHELQPYEYNEYYALALLEGWAPDDEWKKVGTVAAAVHNSALRVAASNGMPYSVNDVRDAKDYVPEYSNNPEDYRKATLSVDDMESRAKARYG